jgi:hypothetical protein
MVQAANLLSRGGDFYQKPQAKTGPEAPARHTQRGSRFGILHLGLPSAFPRWPCFDFPAVGVYARTG